MATRKRLVDDSNAAVAKPARKAVASKPKATPKPASGAASQAVRKHAKGSDSAGRTSPTPPASKALAPATAPARMSTRSIILHHAARLLRENGYAAVSLRQIAAEANIKAGSIYYHFDSKEDILHHVLEEGLRVIVQEVNKAVADLPQGTPFRERLKAVIKSHLYGLLQVGDFSSANIRIYGQVPPEVRKRHYVTRRAFADWWDEFLAQAVAEGALRADLNLSIVRVFIVGALNWTVEWYDPARGSFDTLAENLYIIISDGLVSD